MVSNEGKLLYPYFLEKNYTTSKDDDETGADEEDLEDKQEQMEELHLRGDLDVVEGDHLARRGPTSSLQLGGLAYAIGRGDQRIERSRL